MDFHLNRAEEQDGENRIVSWDESRYAVSAEMRKLVDAALQKCNQDRELRQRIQQSLQAVAYALATSLEEKCKDIPYRKSGIIKRREASSLECAKRLLQMLPEYHALMGESFTSNLPAERREKLIKLGMRNPEEWLSTVRTRLIALLRNIDKI